MTAKDAQSAFESNINDFNSTTQLTEKPDKTIDTTSSNYDPFANRNVEKPNSTSGTLIHLLKSSLGSGILSMPLAFKNSGYMFGAFGTLVVGIICTHCVHILVRTSHKVCQKTNTPSLGFAETAEKVFACGPLPLRSWSKVARNFGDYGLMFTYFGACAVYLVFVARTLERVINYELHLDWSVRTYIAIVTIAMLVLGQIRVLKYLVPFSMAANIMIGVVLATCMYYMLREPLDFSDRKSFSSWGQLPSFFATVVFAMEGIGSVMPLENEMKKPQHFLGCPGVLNTAMGTVIVLYTLIGFLGYIRYGDQVGAMITLNIPLGDIPGEMTQYLIAFAVLFTFGLQFYVPTDILWRKISNKIDEKNHNIAQILMRTAIILAMAGVSMAIPDLEPFISLVGAIFFSLLGLFYPAVVESVFEWPNTGRFHWILIKNVILICVAFFALVTGSLVSIDGIVKFYAGTNDK